jgi:hypothetical protein
MKTAVSLGEEKKMKKAENENMAMAAKNQSAWRIGSSEDAADESALLQRRQQRAASPELAGDA